MGSDSRLPTPDSRLPIPFQFQFPLLLSRRQTQLICYGSHQSQQPLIFVN
ncbi:MULTISPECIES: hypothetical protein [Moorena]|nr:MULTISPECIES: hypothetical protein [Moorena]NEP36042.1 hypothetical protein [Moorena sp. SIO3B2]NEP68615.1 hypothetical protein [Moorena sp. SIO3A5]NEQ07968.1 hypothetical protein [Moorena sp. SIO4E2]